MGIFSRWISSRTPSEIDARLVPVLQMMALDGRADPKEGQTLAAYLIRLGITPDQVMEVQNRAVGKAIPLPTDPHQRLEVLGVAALMMICDGDIDVRELAFYHVLAARMSVPAEIASSMLIQAVKLGDKVNPEYDLESELSAAIRVLAVHLA
jgi:hypothetical protein